MIFEKYFRKSFYFDLREYCADLPLGASGIVIVLYCCINLFMPLCFKTLSLQLTIAPWGAFLLLMLFLYFEKSSIPEICSFRKLEPGNGSKVTVTLLLVMLLVFICNYWSGEFFKLIGLSVDETQPIAETLKEASLTEIILIGVTTIIFAPIGEEIVFRRMLYGILLQTGPLKALLLTSFLFSIAHFYLAGIPGLFFFALLLQLLYLNTRNLWCPIQLHVVFNAMSFISVLAQKN